MSDVTGALHHEFNGRSHTLRLTLGGIAKTQGKHGEDLGGLLSGKFDSVEGSPPKIPPFGIMIDLVAAAIEKGEGLPPAEALDLADDMLTADQSMFQRLMAAAFPGATSGNERTLRKAKA